MAKAKETTKKTTASEPTIETPEVVSTPEPEVETLVTEIPQPEPQPELETQKPESTSQIPDGIPEQVPAPEKPGEEEKPARFRASIDVNPWVVGGCVAGTCVATALLTVFLGKLFKD